MKLLNFISFAISFMAALVVDLLWVALSAAAVLYVGLGLHPIEGAIVGISLTLFLHFVLPKANRRAGVAYDLTLYKELFATKLLEKYRVDGEFLKEVTNDYSSMVDSEGHSINWAEIGADPRVFENSSLRPMPVAQLNETVVTIGLNEIATESTYIGRIDKYLNRLDRQEVAVMRHRKALQDRIILRAAQNYAPLNNTDMTPVVGTTGGTESGHKKMAIDDIIDLDKAFNLIDAPKNRVLVLHPTHKAQILKEDKDLMKSFANVKTGEALDMYGFKIYVSNSVPRFNKSTLTKVAWGAQAQNTDAPAASFAFCPDEVMKAMGATEAFFSNNDIHYRANLLGFNQFYIAQAIRDRSRGAIVSVAA